MASFLPPRPLKGLLCIRRRASVKKRSIFWKREVIFDVFNCREPNYLLCGAEIHHIKGSTEVGEVEGQKMANIVVV